MAIHIKVDTGDFERFAKRLDQLNKRGMPHAMRNALNAIAFEAQVTWRKEIEQRLVIRAKGYTTRSIKVERAKGIDVKTMRSVVGSTTDYMGEVEAGATMTSQGKLGKPVPTGFASGEDGARVPKRLPISSRRMANIQLLDTRIGRTDKQRRFLAMHLAAKRGVKFALVKKPDGSGLGIYQLLGKQRKTKRGITDTIRPTMVWDLSKKTVRTKPHPTLQPALVRIQRVAPRILAREVKKQIMRHLARVSV